MTYQLSGLDPQQFEPLFDLDEATLAARGMRWMTADAPVGEQVLLLPHTHQDSRSPYRASGPIFVRCGIREAARVVGALPPYLANRWLSVRA